MGLFSKHTVSTNRKTKFFSSRAKVDILKLDIHFFFEKSAIPTPARIPASTSEKDSKIAASCNDGIKSIAAAFKWFEDDNKKRVVVTGHVDGSDKQDGIPDRYKLSKQRAQCVVYLLTGERTKWAKVAVAKHQVKDYQLFLKYFSYRRYGTNNEVTLGCDPWKVDNIWGDRTRGGLRNFCVAFNSNFGPGKKFHNLVSADTAVLPTSAIVGGTHKDQNHLCTNEALWKAFFDLLSLDLCALTGNGSTLLQLKSRRDELKFADNLHKFIACGHSYPLKGLGDEKKSKYDPEPGRGVEVLFFDKGDIPGKKKSGVMRITCPDTVDKAHEAKICPIFYKYHLKATYFDHRVVGLVTYHLQFMYYDRIRNECRYVPEGLKIEAYYRDKAGNKKDINDVISDFNKGVYAVKIPGDKERKNIFFTFKTEDPADVNNLKWVYTENKDATPKIVTKTKNEIDGLAFTERMKYYDLSVKWSSENYWTRYDMDMKKGDVYEKVMKTKKYKPYGSQVTISSKPLMFSLDDIVLAQSNRSCSIRDKNKDDNQFPANAPLDDNSRYTLFHVDYTTKEDYAGARKNMRRLKIYNTNAEPEQPCFTDVPFKANLITDVPGHTRMIYFCNGFYDAYDKRTRTTDPGFNQKKHVLGARMAMLNDPDVHGSHPVVCTNAADRANTYATGGAGVGDCGNYELHYFHNCAELDGKLLGYMIIHWSCRLRISLNPNVFGQAVTPGTADDVGDHRKFGMKNAMKRLNKDYLIEKKSGPNDILIRPFHFMEAKNDTNGGAHKTMTSVVGGYPGSGAWMTRPHAQFRSGAKNDGSRYGDWEADPGYFADFGNFPDSDGRTYAALTNHHEMGHATGNLDDYLYDTVFPQGTTWRNLPAFNQQNTAPGGPYSLDNCGRMNRNASPRLREFWKFVCWLHDASQAGNEAHKVLNNLFTGTKFRITFRVYNPPKDFTHKFELIDEYKNIFTHAHQGLNQSMNGNSNTDLLLYKQGDDETSRIIKDGHNFKGILVVRTKLGIKFDPWEPDPEWTLATARDWVQALNNRFKQMLNKKFFLALPDASIDANDYSNWDKIYICFVPHFAIVHRHIPAGSPPGTLPVLPALPANHIAVEVDRVNANNFAHAGSAITCNSGWQATEEEIHKRIIRFCFGFTAGTNDLAKNNFSKIVQWLNGLNIGGGANFTMKDM